MDMKFLIEWLAFMRQLHTAKRPWAHYSKKGPGRKHQQGRIPIKKEHKK
jgi:hypothetical protein